jgi:hypothetical protein
MGVKIKIAWNTVLEKNLSVSLATDVMRKNKQFVCHPTKCNAKLTWVQRHKKDFKIESKFYRLLQGEIHSSECDNNTLGRVLSIAQKSDNKIIENISKGKFEFRLNLVFESEEVISKELPLIETKPSNKDSNHKDRLIINRGEKSPYISTMRDIMKLRSEVEESSELASFIKLKYNGKTISWNSFYFELQEAENSYRYIEIYGLKWKDRKKLDHIICSEFVLKKDNIKKVKNFYVIQSIPKFSQPDNNKESHIYKVVLKTDNLSLVEKLNADFETNTGNIVFVGFYIPSILNEVHTYKTNNGVHVFEHNIEGWLNFKEQIQIA